MEINVLKAISPLDGRYHSKTHKLDHFFSEFALFKYRVQVEVEYFIALSQLDLPQLPAINEASIEKLREAYQGFDLNDANRIKEIERKINHDVKAVEYFVKEHLEAHGLGDYKEFVHFGLTSQDINNTAIPLSIKAFHEEIYVPAIHAMHKKLEAMAEELKAYPMLARTHGQPASPTTIGKEIQVFAERLESQFDDLGQVPFSAKFGGATGNLNAHRVAYPDENWLGFADRFLVYHLGLERQKTTTQIEHYDDLAARFDAYKRINTILLDLCRDICTYISMDYFKQKVNKDEVGS
jgi:adenylosuccinate lyase